jgi:hypothetical protein
MTHNDFAHLLGSINALSPEQMRQLSRELEIKLAATLEQPAGQGSTGAMKVREQPAASHEATALTYKPIWEVAAEIRKSIPAEEWAKLPTDGARQLDHYIYGSPKRPPA